MGKPSDARSSSVSTRSRLRVCEFTATFIADGFSTCGMVVVSRDESGLETRNIMICVGTTSPPPGNGAGPSLVSTKNCPDLPVKSTIASKRSAGACSSVVSATGAGSNPPSVPITLNCGPAMPCGVPLESVRTILMLRKRALQPLSMRRR